MEDKGAERHNRSWRMIPVKDKDRDWIWAVIGGRYIKRRNSNFARRSM
jgi:hypothetical protein